MPFNPPEPGVHPAAVDIAQVGTDLHAVVLGTDGGLYHSNGAWDGFHGIGSEIPIPGGRLSDVSITASSGALHVAINAGENVYHAIRRADRTWQPFGDVEQEAGQIRWISGVTIAGT